jgi:hypothetical protein
MQALKLLAGVLVGIGVSVSSALAQSDVDSRIYFIIDVKCPSENNGTLQITKANSKHVYSRLVARYEGNILTYASLAIADDSTPFKVFKVLFDTKLKDYDYDEIFYAQRAAAAWTFETQDGCQGSEESRRRYFESLKANKVRLGLQ